MPIYNYNVDYSMKPCTLASAWHQIIFQFSITKSPLQAQWIYATRVNWGNVKLRHITGSYAGIVLHVVDQEWLSSTSQVHQGPITGKLTALSEVERHQAHLEKMKGGAEPLVKTCLHDLPSKHPTTTALFNLLDWSH